MKVDTALQILDEAVGKHVSSDAYDARRDAYEDILVAVRDTGRESVVDDLTRWMDEYVRSEKSLPTVEQVDERAVELLERKGDEVPGGSILSRD